MRLFFVALTLTWLAFGTLQARKKKKAQSHNVLPLHQSSTLDWYSSHFDGGFFWATWSTTRFNHWPKRLVFSPSLCKVLYDLGVLLCIATTLISLAVLARATASFQWSKAVSPPDGSIRTILKRSIPASNAVSAAYGVQLQPLLPGLTTPLNFLPSFMLAMICSGAFHELGHAIPATLSVSLLSRLLNPSPYLTCSF